MAHDPNYCGEFDDDESDEEDEEDDDEDYSDDEDISWKVHLKFSNRLKAINIKRKIRVIVGDLDNIIGDCQTEIIEVLAEAYDVALDMRNGL